MVEQQDSFWKLFFTVVAGTLVLAAFVITVLLLKPSSGLPTLPHADSGEPYAYAQGPELTATSTFFYRESIPLGYSNTSWGATTSWRSGQRRFEGSYAARASFTDPWGGLALAGHGISTASLSGISLAVFAEEGINDLYLELYNTTGATIGRQSIGWYFPANKLETGHWQVITIPLVNFGAVPSTIGGFAIISEQKGVVYVDDVYLAKNTPPHAAWAPTPEVAGLTTEASISDLFARTKPIELPYSLLFEGQEMLKWHAPAGQFVISEDGIKVGPPATGGGMHATFLGGKAWTDYRIDTTVLWGQPASISLVARIADENSQVSCAFSQLGTIVQVYVMKNGVSKLARESAYTEIKLPSRLEWAKVPLAMEVKGGRVNCYAHDRLLLSVTHEELPAEGSAGIEVWDEKPNKGYHLIKSFYVSPL